MDPTGNRTRELPACSAVPQPTEPPGFCTPPFQVQHKYFYALDALFYAWLLCGSLEQKQLLFPSTIKTDWFIYRVSEKYCTFFKNSVVWWAPSCTFYALRGTEGISIKTRSI